MNDKEKAMDEKRSEVRKNIFGGIHLFVYLVLLAGGNFILWAVELSASEFAVIFMLLFLSILVYTKE